jgi:FMN-dependent NADH-azoreductase
MRILRIDSSVQTESAQSRRLTTRIIDRLHSLGKSPEVTVCDLNERLPQIDRAWVKANNTLVADHTEVQRKTLALSDKLVTEIEAADILIVGVALYNFSIPASLKL